MSAPRGFWLQLSTTHRDEVMTLRHEWAQSDEGAPGVVLAPVTTRAKLVETVLACEDERVFLDPCGYLFDRAPTVRSRRYFRWLVGPGGDAGEDDPEDDPDDEVAELWEADGDESAHFQRPETIDEWVAWMRASIEHDVGLFESAGRKPSLLVSPCPLIESMVAGHELTSVANAFRQLESEYPNLAPSFCVGPEFTRTEAGVTRLANTLVGLEPSAVLLRCFQTKLPPIGDRQYLKGLREVVGACASNGIDVLLPNSGWVGWLAMAWGAHAYSGGATQSSWYDRVPTAMNQPPRVDRIHDGPLITRREFDLGPHLEAVDGYEPCDCASCKEMDGIFSDPLARTHQMRVARSESLAVGDLQEPRARRLLIKGRLAEADQLWHSLPAHLRQSIDGGHLGLWNELA